MALVSTGLCIETGTLMVIVIIIQFAGHENQRSSLQIPQRRGKSGGGDQRYSSGASRSRISSRSLRSPRSLRMPLTWSIHACSEAIPAQDWLPKP